jgi:tetratricopeptide (TPR) repeat protein
LSLPQEAHEAKVSHPAREDLETIHLARAKRVTQIGFHIRHSSFVAIWIDFHDAEPPRSGLGRTMAMKRSSRPHPVRRGAWLALLLVLGATLAWAPGVRVGAQAPPMGVRVWETTLPLPTYQEGLPDPNSPFDVFAPPRFNYPYTLRSNLTAKRSLRSWRALNLENEYLKCTVLPDLGGHLYSCTDKLNDAQVFYANPSIKFAQIAYRGAWTALGVEFNFPVSHNWMTASPVDFAMTRYSDGSASIWVGNIDRAYGMQWLVELMLRPGQAALEQRTTLYNRADTRQRFYWWTNAGVEVWDDSRIIYPMELTASHGFADIDTWPVDGAGVDLSIVGNHKSGPVSRFSFGSREPYMAVYHPRTKAGVVHYSSPWDLPAKKIWSWGSNADGLDWRRALSDDNSAYVEIQAGIFRDQETYGFLEPQESIRFTEFWIPIRDLGGLARANPDAAVNMVRRQAGGGESLDLALNVTRAVPNAALTIADGTRVLSSDRMSLSPERTFTRLYPGVPAGRPCTFTLRDQGGAVVLAHTENTYDFAPRSGIKTGPQPSYAYLPPAQRSDNDFLALGIQQELDGKKLVALSTYREGLQRFPDSIDLNRASGRLEVGLKQYEPAVIHLSKVLDRVSNDREADYYLGLALNAQAENRRARLAFEAGQSYGTFRPASLLALAAAASRAGNRAGALSFLERATSESTGALRAGGMEVALLRSLGRTDEARRRCAQWQVLNPTSSLERYEATRLGVADEGLWEHLAGDPERILEIAVDYVRFGLYEDAIDLLGRTYPTTENVVSEPGMPRPETYPLIAYYRGYCRDALGQSGKKDLDAASKMPTTYVFPNRADSLPVLRRAIAINPNDATAHFLLGSLLLSGGMAEEAMREWDVTRRLNPAIPVLHRNMGYTLLSTGGSPEKAVGIFLEGTKYDLGNIGVYVGLEQAMSLAGRSADERARTILSFHDQNALPASLVYRLAMALAESGRFDEAEKQFSGRFFPREEGGVNVRGVWVAVRLRRAEAFASQGQCDKARVIVDQIGREVPGLTFTRDGLDPFIKSAPSQELIGKVRAACGARLPH